MGQRGGKMRIRTVAERQNVIVKQRAFSLEFELSSYKQLVGRRSRVHQHGVVGLFVIHDSRPCQQFICLLQVSSLRVSFVIILLSVGP